MNQVHIDNIPSSLQKLGTVFGRSSILSLFAANWVLRTFVFILKNNSVLMRHLKCKHIIGLQTTL